MGLPPLIGVLFIASVLSQNLLAYPPLLVVFSLCTGIAVSHVAAPFATTTMMLTALLKEPPSGIIRWNAGFGVAFYLLMQLLAPLLQRR